MDIWKLVRCTQVEYEPLSAQRLDSWNAIIDNLGSLMNIATSIMSKTD